MKQRGSAKGITVPGDRFAVELRKRYPDLSSEELAKVREIILKEIGERIAAGEQLAFLGYRPGGEVEITVLGLEVLEKRATGAE